MGAGGDWIARQRAGLAWNREPLDGPVPRTRLGVVMIDAVLAVLWIVSAASASDPWLWATASVFVLIAVMWSISTARAVRAHGWEPLSPGDRLGVPNDRRRPHGG